jgi:hypothetical protein
LILRRLALGVRLELLRVGYLALRVGLQLLRLSRQLTGLLRDGAAQRLQLVQDRRGVRRARGGTDDPPLPAQVTLVNPAPFPTKAVARTVPAR